MEDILANFSCMMRKRLEVGVYTTEDSIRYTFFTALLACTGLAPHDIVLELPHPQVGGAEIDTVLPSLAGRPVAIEFKYDRDIPSRSAVPRPQNAGELFKDICRLALFLADPEPERLLVYCTDRVMVKYFQNPENGHTSFFGLPKCERLRIDSSYVACKPATFRNAIGAEPLVELECRWSESLPKEHELRVYGVTPLLLTASGAA